MKRLVVAMLLGPLAGSIAAEELSLEQAVASAIAEHPQLQASFNEFKSYTESYAGAKGGYYPTVDLVAGAGWDYYDNSIEQSRNDTPKEVGISIRQMLFDGFSTSNEVERTSMEARAAQWSLFSQAENLALRVSEVYLEVLKNQQLLKLSEQNLETHLAIQSDIKRRTDAGVGSSADLTQVQGRVARANTNVLSARNNLQDAQAQYVRVLNQLPKDLTSPEADALLLPSDQQQAIKKALDQHPTLRSANFDVQASNAQYQRNKANYYPEVTFEIDGNWDWDSASRIPLNQREDDLSAMVKVRYNLFRGGQDAAEVRRSAHQIAQAKAIGDDSHRQVEEGTRLSWNALEVLTRQKEFLQQHVENSESTVKAYRKQFNIGRRSLLDVLNTENELFQAQTDFITANFDELTARYRLLNATGELLASLRVEKPEQWSFE
ncbi:channel protein TolC [Alginatibacterium sediminis]|uniref:Channel protein TolC n=1 Tax=Alginatibacterium sediminis TaxID=2164068 RepID=A0A420E5S3_9ALTE|nr:TolC family outer membrane protein [Alginatibacterium sediminis]RKF12822.1 channel protein TolC [Alginatibacterium sediminis]